MPTRFQDPKIEIRTDVKRPFYFVRPYVAVVMEDGVQRPQKKVPLRFCDEMTLKQAKAAKEQIMAPINTGRFPLQAQLRFDAIVAKYLDARVPLLAVPTQIEYRTIIAKHIRPAFAKLSIVDTPTVAAWLNSKTGLGVGIDMGRKREKREKRIPNREQLERFLAALPNTTTCSANVARLIVLVAVIAGLRVSEVLGLKLMDIDRERQTIEIRRRFYRGNIDIPKTEASRRIRQIGPFAGELLQHARGKKADDFLFSREDGYSLDDRTLLYRMKSCGLLRRKLGSIVPDLGCMFSGGSM